MVINKWRSYLGTSLWSVQNDIYAESSVWYTQNDDAIYAISLKWPENNYLVLESVYDMLEENELTIYVLESKELLQVIIIYCVM